MRKDQELQHVNENPKAKPALVGCSPRVLAAMIVFGALAGFGRAFIEDSHKTVQTQNRLVGTPTVTRVAQEEVPPPITSRTFKDSVDEMIAFVNAKQIAIPFSKENKVDLMVLQPDTNWPLVIIQKGLHPAIFQKYNPENKPLESSSAFTLIVGNEKTRQKTALSIWGDRSLMVFTEGDMPHVATNKERRQIISAALNILATSAAKVEIIRQSEIPNIPGPNSVGR